MKFRLLVLSLAVAFGVPSWGTAVQSDAAPKIDVGNPAPSHEVTIDGIKIDIVMQAPHLMRAPLQTFGVFKYQAKKDGFSGADLEMDEGFDGVIQQLRKEDGFGHLGENLLLTPKTGGAVKAEKILVVGLGDPKSFQAKDMEQVGANDIRVACQLGLSEFSHASDVQDGGVTRIDAGLIAENVLRGMIRELRQWKKLAAKGLVPDCSLRKISYLAGPKYLATTIASVDKSAKEWAR